MIGHTPSRGAIPLGILVLTAGCVGFLMGSEPLSFTASKATIDDATLSRTGYELKDERTVRLNRTVEIQGQKRRVEITNRVVTYSKSVAGTEAGIAVVVSTPQAKAFGQALNPLGRISERELLERALSGAGGGLRNVRAAETRSATVLGRETDVEVFSATAKRGGQRVDVSVYVTRVAHEEDYVIGAVIVPADLPDGEADAMALLAGIEH